MTTPTIEEMRKTLAKVQRALACHYIFEEPGHVISERQEDAEEVCTALASALEQLETAINAIESESDPDAPGRLWLVEHVLSILRGSGLPPSGEGVRP